MNQREIINQLLEDMDIIRPIAIAAMPDDNTLRARTRRMIADLETMKHAPSVSLATYLWLTQLTAKLLDAEHGALLKPGENGELSEQAKAAIANHIEERRSLLVTALQEIPTTATIINQISALLGKKLKEGEALHSRARHLHKTVSEHLRHDAALRGEMQQFVAAFTPSINAISTVLKNAGEDSPELKLATQMLEQDLPDDAEEARALLQNARQRIQQAGSKLANASQKLSDTLQENMEKLSTLSNKLQQAESEARNDPLTSLANRRHLAEFLNTLGQSSFSFLVVDIDFFKKINDTYGHDVGDEILRQLAGILRDNIRDTDLAARIGGEEFCIVFPSTDLETSRALAEKLRVAIASHPFKTARGKLDVTVSIGVAQHHPGNKHSATFKAADTALYQSKKSGRNRVTAAQTTSPQTAPA